ncbi:MAG: serpin family protein [Anaerovoracaceae bacterium]
MERKNKKLLRNFISLLMVFLMIFSLAACGETASGTTDLTGTSRGEESPFTLDVKCTVGEYDDLFNLGVELFKNAAALSETEGENVVFSPVSAMSMLASLSQAADGETLKQIEDAAGKDDELFTLLMDGYCRSLNGDKETALVRSANSFWMRDEEGRLALTDEFLAKCRYLDTQVFSAPFDKSTVSDINRWCSDHTDGMIEKIVDRISSDAVAYLLNALTYENKWLVPYEKEQLRTGIFTDASGSSQKAEFMYSDENRYFEDEIAEGFIKPYKDGFSFIAIRPKDGVTTDGYISRMTGETLRNLINEPQQTAVSVGIPEFSNEGFTNLVPVFESMGMKDIFDSVRADLTRMGTSSRGNIYIGAAFQKAFIEVNSDGTRAAAVSIAEAKDGCAMVEESKTVILDKPFIYIIADDSQLEGLPLFMGTVEKI